MNKLVFAIVLGGVLGIFDGMTALISAPETRSQIAGIVAGSTFKGVLVGLVVGLVARRTASLAVGVLVGLTVGAFLAYLVTLGGPYFWEIMLPGTVLGAIVGYATFTYRTAARSV
ncbi:MAG: hypothetical protein ABR606_07180 [Vicinamibacterales bacterium]